MGMRKGVENGRAQWARIVVVGVNNSFHGFLLHKYTFLVPTIVAKHKNRHFGDFWRF